MLLSLFLRVSFYLSQDISSVSQLKNKHSILNFPISIAGSQLRKLHWKR